MERTIQRPKRDNPAFHVLAVQKVLFGSGRATRRWPMYFRIRRSLPARSQPDNTFWTDSTRKTPRRVLKGVKTEQTLGLDC